MNNKQVTNHCGVCDKPKDDGIYLYQLFICSECEKDIVTTEPDDAAYSVYVKKLRAINQSTFTI
ncbi:sigma-G inhibitor, Gin [Gracilibacillus oryzae]|uniref:Sigma-G inhibitor, Gin n=1 Tax=Gracilibacillus oryzae TaxID=1672701 RepID=A0A7C8GQI4_9BACI|nr:sigma factor G inhibitor Gin [Gracilibacillus oryzae]KAB8126534.1 sigma-G inhibitor, Gin [Gracilibacillus oryzae]